MPVTLVRKRTKAGGGRKTVQYRDTRGRTFDAVITGAGTGDTVNLRIIDRNRSSKSTGVVLEDIPLATSMKSTNAYFNRLV